MSVHLLAAGGGADPYLVVDSRPLAVRATEKVERASDSQKLNPCRSTGDAKLYLLTASCRTRSRAYQVLRQLQHRYVVRIGL